MPKVIVVGAGMIGSSVAFRLVQSGVEVVVVDRAEPASGTTGSSFAWVNANEKIPRSYFDLNVAGMREHDRLEGELGGAPWLHRVGNLTWTGDPVRYDELCRRMERLQSWGYNAAWLAAEDVNQRLEPGLTFSGPNMRVAWFPDESWLDGPLFARSMLDRAAYAGGTLRTGQAVTGLNRTGAGYVATLADRTRIEADAVVNAAGPDADQISGMLGRHLPLSPSRGLLVRVAVEGQPLGRIVHGTDINVRPDGAGFLMLHHESADPLLGDRDTIPPDDSRCRDLCKRARRVLPGISAARISEARIGVRPFPRDGVSCLGEVPGIPGFYEAVTHSAVTMGPLVGRLIADEIVLGNVDPMLTEFRPGRF